MAPKKSTGFMMLVHEWRASCEEGRKMPISEAVNHVGGIWKNMSEQERAPYHAYAKQADAAQRVKRERLNCKGQSVADAERQEQEAADQIVKMKRNIERIVLEGRKKNDLENTKFIFASFNYFTKAINSDVCIPAEFAACEYSLKSGMSSIYSSHINPGSCIFGQGSDALHHTATTHQLPLPPQSLGESNMGRLYKHIIAYMRPIVGEKKPLLVFTPTSLMPIVRACFRYLKCTSEEEQQEQEIPFVYDIQYLFYVLKKEVQDIAAIKSHKVNNYITDAVFLKDFFEYQAGISCLFHEENDRGRYCTQSMVTRWCYTFSDYMCGDLAIPLLSGCHKPPTLKPSFHVTYDPDLSSLDLKDKSMSSYYSGVSRLKRKDSNNTWNEPEQSILDLKDKSMSSYYSGVSRLKRKDSNNTSKKEPEPIPLQKLRDNVVPEHLMSPWHLPRKPRIPQMDDDDFFIFGAGKKNSSSHA